MLRLTVMSPGVVETRQMAILLGFEVRYRLLLHTNIYLDLAAGVQSSRTIFSASGPALFSGQSDCDPLTRACSLQVRDGEHYADRASSWGVGPSFGADLRLSILSIGYRFTPSAASWNLPNMHSVVIGLGF